MKSNALYTALNEEFFEYETSDIFDEIDDVGLEPVSEEPVDDTFHYRMYISPDYFDIDGRILKKFIYSLENTEYINYSEARVVTEDNKKHIEFDFNPAMSNFRELMKFFNNIKKGLGINAYTNTTSKLIRIDDGTELFNSNNSPLHIISTNGECTPKNNVESSFLAMCRLAKEFILDNNYTDNYIYYMLNPYDQQMKFEVVAETQKLIRTIIDDSNGAWTSYPDEWGNPKNQRYVKFLVDEFVNFIHSKQDNDIRMFCVSFTEETIKSSKRHNSYMWFEENMNGEQNFKDVESRNTQMFGNLSEVFDKLKKKEVIMLRDCSRRIMDVSGHCIYTICLPMYYDAANDNCGYYVFSFSFPEENTEIFMKELKKFIQE